MGSGTVTKAAQRWLTSTRSGREKAARMRKERCELWILDGRYRAAKNTSVDSSKHPADYEAYPGVTPIVTNMLVAREASEHGLERKIYRNTSEGAYVNDFAVTVTNP